MKKLLLITVLALFAMPNTQAQENVVKVNPLGLLFGAAQLSYERVIGDNSSVELSLSYLTLKGTLGTSTDETTVNSFGVEGKYKLYLSSSYDAPRGWYTAPVLNYSKAKFELDPFSGETTAIGAGLLGGYQWVFGGNDSGFALDLNFGAQYLSVKTSGDLTNINLQGVLPRLGLSIGYAF